MNPQKTILRAKKIGIDSYHKAILYMRFDCHLCFSEGFESQSRVLVTIGKRSVIATINIVKSDILGKGELGLSDFAWDFLQAKTGDEAKVTHAKPVDSFSFVRAKIYDNHLNAEEIKSIIQDIVLGYYTDAQIAAFLTSCAGKKMNQDEITYLTKAMVEVGDKLNWDKEIVVDKHSIGGLPGNRTTPIIVAIVAAFGLTMPKTSSRAITSPAGTADTMEVLAPVDLDIKKIQEVVAKENGCISWGGGAFLSPADDIIIRVERILDLDSEGQMVASILSKKIAAGSNHIVIDMPVGKTAKVRSVEMANILKDRLEKIGQTLGIKVKVLIDSGIEPVGRGIGPALEARDILQVLQNDPKMPIDLRKRAVKLAGAILEFSPQVKIGEGEKLAEEILNSGKAWQKFQAICAAQGGMRAIPSSSYQHQYLAKKDGIIEEIDNRYIALIAKLAGAPNDKAAGLDLNVRVGDEVKKDDILFTIHAESMGTLEYALDYLAGDDSVITIKD